MSVRITCSALASALAAFALLATSASAQAVLTGHVLGYDGQPLPLAHVQHVTPDGRVPLETAQAGPDGAFRLPLPSSGVSSVRFLGVGHDPLVTAVAFDADRAAVVEVRLGRPEPVSRAEVITYVKALVGPDLEVPLVLSPEGVLAADTEWAEDSVLVRFLPVLRHGGRSFVPVVDGASYAFDGRDYALRLPVRDGRVHAALDTTLVPRRETIGHAAFADEEALPARYSRIMEGVSARYRARRAQVSIQILENVDQDALPGAEARYADELGFDWEADQARIVAALDTVRHPVLREALLVSYLDAKGERLDAEALSEVVPGSAAWSIRPDALADAAKRSGGEAAWAAYLDAAVEQNADDRVAGRILFDRFAAAREAGRTADAEALYARLTTEAARTNYASYARARFSPDRRVAVGARVPAFSMPPLIAGEPSVTDAALPGRVTLLDFWATWCLPCVAEMETLHRVYAEYRDRGFEVVSVSFDDDPEKVQAFRAERWPMPWLHAYPEGGFESDVAEAFEVSGLPTLVLVTADGTVLATDVDLIGEALESSVRRALASPNP